MGMFTRLIRLRQWRLLHHRPPENRALMHTVWVGASKEEQENCSQKRAQEVFKEGPVASNSELCAADMYRKPHPTSGCTKR